MILVKDFDPSTQPDRIAQIKARLSRVTGWRWRMHRNAIIGCNGQHIALATEAGNADLIAHAPGDLQVLLDEREALIARVEALEAEALARAGGAS